MNDSQSRKSPPVDVKESELLGGDWASFRQAMPICQKWVYFDHAAVGPLSAAAAQAVASWSQEASEEGDTVWPNWNRAANETRDIAARLIQADPDEVALVNSTTQGIGLVAEGLPWQKGDNVVTLANEFPANLYPWMNLASRGVETRMVAPDSQGRPCLDAILEAIDARTRLVAISWVGFANGFRIDLAKFVDAVHQKGCLFFLDAIQGLGVFPLDVKSIPVDFLAADGHKWMLGPEGAGVFYLRAEHLSLLRPIGVGWNSVVHRYDFNNAKFDLRSAASRYEGGSLNNVGFLALAKSLSLLERYGLAADSAKLAERVLHVTGYAIDELKRLGAEVVSPQEDEQRSGIVTFQFPEQDHAMVRNACLRGGIVTSHRNGCLRISPHAYNNESDVDQLISCLRQEIGKSR